VIPAFDHGAREASDLAGFQMLIGRCPTASDRKRLVIAAWECGALRRRETHLLIDAYMLETA
jgi:hypothetical protein